MFFVRTIFLVLLSFNLAGEAFADSRPVELKDASGSITTGNTAQTALAANPSRSILCFQNVSAGDLWIDFTVTAVMDSPSLKFSPGPGYCWENAVPTNAISVIGATTGQKFTIKWR